MDKENSFTILKDGKETNCDIYFSFVSEENNKGYIAYTDHSLNESQEENIYMASFDPEIGLDDLKEVTDTKEIAMFNDVLARIKNNA